MSLSKDGRSATHSSETSLQGAAFTAVLDNNGTLPEFLALFEARAWPLVATALSPHGKPSHP
jgi:hypothetical protein